MTIFAFVPASFDPELPNPVFGITKLDLGIAILDFGIAKPDFRIAILDFRIAIPDFGIAKLDRGIAIPDFSNAKPDLGIAIPDRGIAILKSKIESFAGLIAPQVELCGLRLKARRF